jgi:hypothetical protein
MWRKNVQAAVRGSDLESAGEDVESLPQHRPLQVLYINDHRVD